MAVEDAVALAESMRFITRKEMVPQAVAIFEQVRIPRVEHVHEASVKHGYTMHLSDGPEQQRRDKALEKEVKGEHSIASPNHWSDPTVLNWLYPHRPALAVRRAWKEQISTAEGKGEIDGRAQGVREQVCCNEAAQ